MTGRLLISALPGETRALWIDDDDRLARVRVLRADRPGAHGDRFLGRVVALDRGLEAAFVEIGLARPGLLPFGRGGEGLTEGAAVVVRIVRAPSEDKGAKLAREAEAPPAGLSPPRCLTRADDPLAELLRAAAPPDEIRIDDPTLFQEARARLAGHPALAGALKLHSGPGPLIDDALAAEVEALTAPRVELPGGGFLLIEPVRTLTAIDVNSGAHDGRGGAAARALELNLLAAAEIARQIRLRELSGLIVVDFLEVERREQRGRVVEVLRAGLVGDPEPVEIQPMRASGLVEIARRRARPPLHECLAERCGIEGGGWRREPASLAFELIRRALAARPSGRLRLLVSPRVAAALAGPAAGALAALAARRGHEPDILADAQRADEAGEIVLK